MSTVRSEKGFGDIAIYFVLLLIKKKGVNGDVCVFLMMLLRI